MLNTASRQNRQARCPTPITKCRITPSKTIFLIQKIFYEYYNAALYGYSHIHYQPILGKRLQIYTETTFVSPIPYGQRAPFNLLILNIYDIEEMDKSPKAKYLFKETEKVILH